MKAILVAFILLTLAVTPAAAQIPNPNKGKVQWILGYEARQNGCDVYGVNDLDWAAFSQPLNRAGANKLYACGPQGIAWTIACFTPVNAEAGIFPMAERFYEWVPCFVAFSNRSQVDVPLDPTQFVLMDELGNEFKSLPDGNAVFGPDVLPTTTLQPGESATGLLVFLAESTLPTPFLVRWKTTQFGNDSGGYLGVVITQFNDSPIT